MKAFAILGAIVFAWISGAGTDAGEKRTHAHNGAIVYLILALICGVLAWRM